MSRPRLVVFDLAGTTVRDDGQVATAFAAAMGEGFSAEQLAAVRGMAKRDAIARLVPERAAEVFDAFCDRLRDELAKQPFVAMAGAAELFDTFRERGVKVALNTGFDRELAELVIDSLGWRTRVDAIVTADDVAHGRPAPDMIFRAMEWTGVTDPREVANVGDTVADLEAAHAAGVRWSLGVLSGAHDRAKLERAPHTQLLASIADLRDFAWTRDDEPAGETDLARLLATMRPHLDDRPFVFCVVESAPANLIVNALGTFRESEGLTLILEQSLADAHGLAYTSSWAWITLTVHSSLTAVGFIAAVSARLAEAGLSVNPVAGYYHDHLFVPWEHRDRALEVLGAACRSQSEGI